MQGAGWFSDAPQRRIGVEPPCCAVVRGWRSRGRSFSTILAMEAPPAACIRSVPPRQATMVFDPGHRPGPACRPQPEFHCRPATDRPAARRAAGSTVTRHSRQSRWPPIHAASSRPRHSTTLLCRMIALLFAGSTTIMWPPPPGPATLRPERFILFTNIFDQQECSAPARPGLWLPRSRDHTPRPYSSMNAIPVVSC